MFLSPANAFTKAAGLVDEELLSFLTISMPCKLRVYIDNEAAPEDLTNNEYSNFNPGLWQLLTCLGSHVRCL